MKEYLKMADYIIGDVSMSINHNGDVSVSYDYADPNMIVRKTMDAMEHAINSHDELVAEVGRLRDALQDAYLDGCHYGWVMSAEGFNAEHGGPNDGKLHNQFIESYSGESYTSE